MNEPSHGYSIDELHAYAKAKNYSDEAEALHYYLELQRRRGEEEISITLRESQVDGDSRVGRLPRANSTQA